MKCDVCRTHALRHKKIRYSVDIDGRFAVVENVLAIVCEQCGETSFEPAVVDSLQELIDGKGQPKGEISVDLYELAS